MKHVELLAPAGTPDALVAAVNNGADAVYLGLGDFNARRGAANFEADSLAEGARFAHLRGARVYLTANIVILPGEMDAALSLVDTAWAAGADAVIVQDLGLLRVLRAELPDVRIHASTQIDATNPETVALLGELGVSRVTLARELPLPAIRACADAGVEIETFVHGALCYSYSGQCLMSSLIGRRSANRGLCAQPCRLAYELLGPDGATHAVPGRYLLSAKDAAAIDHLPALLDAGVSSLKIEGRMKSPEYVAIVTSIYRAALDRATADPAAFEVSAAEWELLEEAFNRGFTDAYLTGRRGAELMSYTRPNNRGVLVGRVASAERGRARVDLERAVDPRDTIEVWTRSGRFAQTVGDMMVDGHAVAVAPAGIRAELRPEQPVAVGDRVFRVASASLLDAARRTFSGGAATDHRAVPVRFGITLRIGQPLSVSAMAGGASSLAEGPVVEPARTKEITADEVIEHVGRLGGSGYRAAGWEIDLESGAGVGFSALHAARREALERLSALRLAPWADRRLRRPRAPSLAPRIAPARNVAVVCTAWDAETAIACRDAGADEVYLRVFAGTPAAPLPDGVRPLLPRVVWPDEVDGLAAWLGVGPALVGNLGLVCAARSTAAVASSTAHTADAVVHADWPLNVLNAHAAAALADLGVASVWASPELSGRQTAALVAASPIPVGMLVWGRTELMIAEQCVLEAAGECGHRCARCPRRDRWWRLRDQKGYEFPVTTDPSGRSHILNSVTLDLSRALDEVVATGVHAVRLDFAAEGSEPAAEYTRRMREALVTVRRGGTPPDSLSGEPVTSGHFFRGVH